MRIARLHFADGHTEETVIPDARITRIRRGDRDFFKVDDAQDELPSYREGAHGDNPESTGESGQAKNDVAYDDKGTFGPSGDDTAGW